MNPNTFRINIGESARGLVDEGYVNEFNERLKEINLQNISFERVTRSGPIKTGNAVNLTDSVNIITADRSTDELIEVFGQTGPRMRKSFASKCSATPKKLVQGCFKKKDF